MSYSFALRATSKAEALLAIRIKLDEVVAQQPVHQADCQQAMQVAETMVALLPDDDSRDVAVTMNGYVSGNWNGVALVELSSVSIGCTAGLIQRNTEA